LSRSLIASGRETFVSTLAVDWSEDTSRGSIASVNSASVVVGAKDWGLDKVSSQAIASVGVAFVLLSKSLEIVFWRVYASLNSIASIFCARVYIGASDWSVDAISIGARVGCASVTIVTIYANMGTVSCGGVTRISCACVIIVTIFRIAINSVVCIASRDGAEICCWRNCDWSVLASSIYTSVFSASIVIVTDNWSIDASFCNIAGVECASIVIITNVVGVSTSGGFIARIISASVAVITVDRSVLALSTGGVAAISCASVSIIAIDRTCVKTLGSCAQPDLAFVSACCILCNEINWGVLASFYDVASISCARIRVVTIDSIVVNCSSCSIAIVFCASIIVVNVYVSVEASVTSVASISCARISIITNNRSRNTSFHCIASFSCAFVCIGTNNRSVSALTRVEIASISCASIVVVTIDRSVDAFSRGGVTSNGLACFSLANNRSENTVSI
jgi:hypothetical protein